MAMHVFVAIALNEADPVVKTVGWSSPRHSSPIQYLIKLISDTQLSPNATFMGIYILFCVLKVITIRRHIISNHLLALSPGNVRS